MIGVEQKYKIAGVPGRQQAGEPGRRLISTGRHDDGPV